MPSDVFDLIPLHEAVLCEACGCISRLTDGRGASCPGCESVAISLLQPMLEGTLQKAAREKLEAGF